MADTNDVVKRALAKLEADRIARESAQPIADAQQIADVQAPASIAAPIPAAIAAPAAVEQVIPSLAPDIMNMQAVVPPQASQEELMRQNLQERAQQVSDFLPKIVGAAAPPQLELEKRLLADQAAQQQQQQQIAAAEMIAREPASAALAPTPQEVQKEYEKQAAPVRQVQAQVQAAQKVQADIADVKKQQDDAKKEFDTEKQTVEEEVRVRSLPEIMSKGSFGEKIGVALLAALGGAAQGLTGAATNPVLDFIDRQVQQQADRDKLKLEQKESLRKALLDEALLKIKQQEAATDSQYKKGLLRAEEQKVVQARKDAELKANEAINQKLMIASSFQGRALTPEQFTEMALKHPDKLVALPNVTGFPKDRQVIVPSEQAKKDFQAAVKDAEVVKSSMKKVQALIDKPWLIRKLDPRTSAEFQVLQAALTAALRIPFTGTGPLTETEREMLQRVIPDPTALADFLNTAQIKSDTIMGQMNASLRASAQAAGIKEPVVDQPLYNFNGAIKTRNQIVDIYRKANPGMSDSAILLQVNKFLVDKPARQV